MRRELPKYVASLINDRPEIILENKLEAGSQWFNRIDAEIDRYRLSLGEKGSRKFKLDLLLRVARRIDQFSQTCGECEKRKQEISRLVQDLSRLLQQLLLSV